MLCPDRDAALIDREPVTAPETAVTPTDLAPGEVEGLVLWTRNVAPLLALTALCLAALVRRHERRRRTARPAHVGLRGR